MTRQNYLGRGAEETNWCSSLYRMQLEDSTGRAGIDYHLVTNT